MEKDQIQISGVSQQIGISDISSLDPKESVEVSSIS